MGDRLDAGAIGVAHPIVTQDDWARAVAIIARATGDPELAEDAVQDAVATALARWPTDGVPANPAAWIVTAARRRAVDLIRRERASRRATAALAALSPTAGDPIDVDDPAPIPDERLAMVFACCHPALDTDAQVALTLRLVAGVDTGRIARMFLVPEATMGQRLSRAKRKVRDAGIPIREPLPEDIPPRRSAVLAVVYLVFTTGYTDPDGADTAAEAIRLGRLLTGLLPGDPEVHALLSLMLLQESRRAARVDADGALVTLAHQDRARWDAVMIREGLEHLRAAWPRVGGHYVLQAAIAACHARSADDGDTDWPVIVALYGRLAALRPNPAVELNRAAAMVFAGRPAEALVVLDGVADRLDGHHGWHAARAEALLRLGRTDQARDALVRARDLAPGDREREHFQRLLDAR